MHTEIILGLLIVVVIVTIRSHISVIQDCGIILQHLHCRSTLGGESAYLFRELCTLRWQELRDEENRERRRLKAEVKTTQEGTE